MSQKAQAANIPVHVAGTEAEIRHCWPVMQQLRPHLDETKFVEMVTRMHKHEGYTLAYTEHAGKVAGVAGFRYEEMLHRGKSMYVDDLITDEALRSSGHGRALLDWLKAEA